MRVTRSAFYKIWLPFISLLRAFFIIRSLKPSILHSHTLLTNLILSVVSSYLEIPFVLSFAGFGKYCKSNTLSFRFIVKLICFFTTHYICLPRFLQPKSNYHFVFQNKPDYERFADLTKNKYLKRMNLICGSGVPLYYFDSNNIESSSNNSNSCTFVYCARLTMSKGILRFTSLASDYPQHNFVIYGGFDHSCSDSLNKDHLSDLLVSNQNLEYRGLVKDPLLQMRGSNVVLLIPSSYGEGFPRAVAEASALNISIFRSLDVKSITEMHSGCYDVDFHDKNNFATALSQYQRDVLSGEINNKLNVNYMATKKYYTEQAIVKNTFSLYNDLLGLSSKSRLSSRLEALSNQDYPC